MLRKREFITLGTNKHGSKRKKEKDPYFTSITRDINNN